MNAQRCTDHSHKGQKREWMKKGADHLHKSQKKGMNVKRNTDHSDKS